MSDSTGRSRPSGTSGQSESFASLLRREREAAGLTQTELAQRAGLGARTVSNRERGINTAPYPSTVRLLCDALELSDEARLELVGAARRVDGRGSGATAATGGHLGLRPPASLVAREAERSLVADALTAVAAGGGRVVVLAGEPGIGKTRLAPHHVAGEQLGAAVLAHEVDGLPHDLATRNRAAGSADR